MRNHLPTLKSPQKLFNRLARLTFSCVILGTVLLIVGTQVPATHTDYDVYQLSITYVRSEDLEQFNQILEPREILNLEGTFVRHFPPLYFAEEGDYVAESWSDFPGLEQRIGAEVRVSGINRRLQNTLYVEGLFYCFRFFLRYGDAVGYNDGLHDTKLAEGSADYREAVERALNIGEPMVTSELSSPFLTEWIIVQLDQVSQELPS